MSDQQKKFLSLMMAFANIKHEFFKNSSFFCDRIEGLRATTLDWQNFWHVGRT